MMKSARWLLGIAILVAMAGCSDSEITLPDPGEKEPEDPKTSLVAPGSTPLPLEGSLLV